jgi:RNA polymerase sigma-70 factor (ECF subfamily)
MTMAQLQSFLLVARLGSVKAAAAQLQTRIVWLNGSPAGRVEFDGELAAAMSVVVEAGRITRIYVTANPDKLGRLDEPAQLER